MAAITGDQQADGGTLAALTRDKKASSTVSRTQGDGLLDFQSSAGGVTREGLFTTLIGILEPGGITSDVSYYTDGKATEADYKNLIKVAFERTATGSAERNAFVDALAGAGFWADTDDLDYWRNKAGPADSPDLENVAMERLSVIGTGAAIDPNTGEIAPLPGDDVIAAEGKTDEFPGVMSGGTLRRVNNPEGQEDYFIMEYEYPPGSGHSFYYNMGSAADVEQAIGPNMGGGSVTIGEPVDESVVNNWTDGGDSNEILGVGGSFIGYIDDITIQAGKDAGIDDPTLVGAALKDPQIAIIMAQGAEGEWTKERIKAALRKTDYYKDVLHPGIENFYGETDNPEAQYAQYKQNVEATLKMLGTPQDPNGGWGTKLKSLLDKGVTDTGFATFGKVYRQAQTNVGFAGSLSKWTEKYTGFSISTFEDYFDVLAGNSPAEVLEIAEIAGLQYMADNVGFEISDQELMNISESINIDQEGAGQLFSKTARDLLSLGERGLRRGGLNSTQVLEAEAGIGGSVEKTKLLMSKLAREEGIVDDPTATIFTDFNREGAPIKKGLGATVSEGA